MQKNSRPARLISYKYGMNDPLPAENLPVDLALLNEVFDNDPTQVREVLVLYLDQTRDQLEKIGHAIASGAAEDLRQVAHKAAGSSSSCGMTRIVPVLRELERMGREKQLAGAEPVHAQGKEEFKAIEQFLAIHLV
jgi:HPt (histidine-containing phosphotransfer) domain-containing protein